MGSSPLAHEQTLTTMTAVHSTFKDSAIDEPSVALARARRRLTWTFQVRHGESGLQMLRNEWRSHLEQHPSTTYLQMPEWFSAY